KGQYTTSQLKNRHQANQRIQSYREGIFKQGVLHRMEDKEMKTKIHISAGTRELTCRGGMF
ncbi:MAG: hypothetical protein CVU06_02305, partial [Bacteroidetes bacterium HGW-Bacteroidetes-22]